ncbi:MAG TPA: DUF3108 domain-containing protein [Novimethylophilus sp.]|jgi:hypothetical protein|uniref:DUF3108 domain-containing protein n=1 Tax=Novimethylophilus sp. TaxID=2137426 RepID=UPI002F41250C
MATNAMMSFYMTRNKVSIYRILVALILSSVLHGLLLTYLSPLSQHRPGNRVLEVRLPPYSLTQEKIIENSHSFVEASNSAPSSAILTTQAQRWQQAPTRSQQLAINRQAAADISVSNKSETENRISVPAPAISQSTDQRSLDALPAQSETINLVEVEFQIFAGEKRTLLGSAIQRYEADMSEGYLLSYRGRLERPGKPDPENEWQLQIEGQITRNGLMPLTFQQQGNMARQLMTLSDAEIENKSSQNGYRSGRMPDGILDRFSMLYQFMRSPPKDDGGTLWLSDGENLSEFAYHMAGIESVEINPLGVLKAVHITILSTNDNSETTELWLVPDLHYLPVKISHRDMHGNTIEQVAVSFNIQ